MSESPTHPDAPRAGGETPAIDRQATLEALEVAASVLNELAQELGGSSPAQYRADVKHIQALRSALPALLDRPAPSEGWQPATTAPRSGEHILITQLGRAGFGYTDGVAQDWCAVAHYWPVAGEEGFYLSAGASSEIDDHPLSFTHWMPLPVVCLCDYSLANAPCVSHQPHCPLSSRSALLERHRDGERGPLGVPRDAVQCDWCHAIFALEYATDDGLCTFCGGCTYALSVILATASAPPSPERASAILATPPAASPEPTVNSNDR